MKIQWIDNNINVVGGIERVVVQLSNFFVDHGCDVEIVSLYSKETNCYFALKPEVVICHYGANPKAYSRIELLKNIHKIVKNSNADIVLGCNDDICNALVINKSFFKGCVIATQHAAIEYYTKKRLIFESFLMRFADSFVVLSEWSKRYYKKMGLDCLVIPNAISQEKLDIQEPREKTIITAGRLTDIKKFDFLIRSFKLVHDVHPDWKLKILGDGEDRNKLAALVQELDLEDAVFLPGFQKNVIEEFRKASLFAVTSRSESFSMVLLEAMTQGLPAVCVDIPVMKELLDHGKYGVLASRDETAFAVAMNSLIENEQLRKEYGEKALERSKNYSMENVGMQWLALFRKLSKKK